MSKIVELKIDNTDVKVTIGVKLAYSFNEHMSVGYWAEFEIEDESVIRHSGTDTAYNSPERMNEPGMSGADAAKTTFFFEAISTGTSLLIVRNIFRGEIENEYKFRITVS
jgi:predicted secreted protein